MMEGLSQIAPCMPPHAPLRTLLPQMPRAQDGLKIQIHPHGHIPLYSQTPLLSHSSLSLWALRTAWQSSETLALLSDNMSLSSLPPSPRIPLPALPAIPSRHLITPRHIGILD